MNGMTVLEKINQDLEVYRKETGKTPDFCLLNSQDFKSIQDFLKEKLGNEQPYHLLQYLGIGLLISNDAPSGKFKFIKTI